MKRFSKALLIVLIGSSFCNLVKADYDSWDTYAVSVQDGVRGSGTSSGGYGVFLYQGSKFLNIQKCTNSGDCTVDNSAGYTFFPDQSVYGDASKIYVYPHLSYVDDENNLILIVTENFEDKTLKFDGRTNTFSEMEYDWRRDFNINTYDKKTITKASDGSIQIGSDANDIDVTAKGINIDGSTLINKSSNTISIGESLRILEDSKKLIMNGNTIIKRNDDGTIQIGTDDDDIDITSQGINVGGRPLITRRANGKIHIGKNSLITTEEEETLSDGRKVQPLYAEDGDGNRIPINIDGSKLLIDGVEVQTGNNAQVTTNKNNISTNTLNISTNTSNISTNTSNISTNTSNIKNLGEGVAGSTALTAALTALPQTSKESKLSCGVGTGAYSSRYAFGFGCASKLNERVDINAGGSYVFGGSKSYGGGTLDSGVVKAGFVFKLGELNKPTQISFKDKKLIDKKISNLVKDNQNLKEKNIEIITQNQKLLARLEKLENIALKLQSNTEMLSFVKKD